MTKICVSIDGRKCRRIGSLFSISRFFIFSGGKWASFSTVECERQSRRKLDGIVAIAFLYMSVREVKEETKQVEEDSKTKSKQQEEQKMDTRLRKADKQTTEEDSWSEDEVVSDKDDEGGILDHVSDKQEEEEGEGMQQANDEERPVHALAFLAACAKKQQHSGMIVIQGILYVGAFYFSWIFLTIQHILELAGAQQIFAMQALDTTLLPLQRICNVYIYLW
jgi:hypothetical protein